MLSAVFYEQVKKKGFREAHRILNENICTFCMLYAVLTAVGVFLLATFKIIDIKAFRMPQNLSMNVNSNANDLGTEYFFPLHITIITSDDRGLPFFSNFGVFCGISHEPHIATYLITPAFFFMYALDWSRRRKYILSFFFICFMLLATSTTNLICFFLVLFILIIINIKNRQDTILNFLFLAVILAVLSFVVFNGLGVSAIQAKLDTSNGTLS